jgi:acyl-CoA thioester hydrolase
MRVAIDPNHATSRIEIRVRFGETDLMGIVHHASYLSYFEAARVAWLRRRGVNYATWAARGWHLPVVEASVRYRAPARFEDVVTVEVHLADVRSHSLRFAYGVTRQDPPRGSPVMLAEGETRLACVNAEHKLMRMPEPLLDVLRKAELTSSGDAVC